jgi:thymidylate synthase ThyX
LANVGMTINARALEHAIQKMLSSPLEEVCCMGETIKQVARNEVPTLVKYADKVPYLQSAEANLCQLNQSFTNAPDQRLDWCLLASIQAEQQLRILAACLYRYGQNGYAQCLDLVSHMSQSERQQLVKTILAGQTRHDLPLREIEHADFTYDIILDQGAYFELKRHRMMTQSPQCLNPSLGYATPKLMSTAGMEKEFCHAMEKARWMYDRLASWNPAVASYIIPNAYNRRVLLTTNLRSLMHLVTLRSADGAHFAIRRIAQRMAEQARQAMPLFAEFIITNPNETWLSIENKYFTNTISK